MKDRIFIFICAVCFLLIFSNIFLIIEVCKQKRKTEFLEKKMNDFEKTIKRFENHIDEKINVVDENISLIISCQKDVKKEIQKDLNKISSRTDAQYTKTVGMSRTFDAILEEQKKKTIDTAEMDESIILEKKKAISMFMDAKYAEAYESFKKLTDLNTDDMECRMYKMKSLYYINRGDSSRFKEILEDVSILKINAAADAECLEIEKVIAAEEDGNNE